MRTCLGDMGSAVQIRPARKKAGRRQAGCLFHTWGPSVFSEGKTRSRWMLRSGIRDQPEKRQVADRRTAFFIPGEPQCFFWGKHEVDGCCAAASETSPKKGRSPTGGLPFSYLGNLSVFRRENSTRKALYSSLIL